MSYLPIFFSDRDLLRRLSYAQVGKVITKLLDDALDEPSDVTLSESGEIVYTKMKQDADRSRANYDQVCSNRSRAAREREEKKRRSTIVHNCGEEKEEEKDKDKYDDKEKDKDNARQRANERAGARERSGGKRFLKNNSVCTYKKEDLFIPVWELEGEDSTKSADGGPA